MICQVICIEIPSDITIIGAWHVQLDAEQPDRKLHLDAMAALNVTCGHWQVEARQGDMQSLLGTTG